MRPDRRQQVRQRLHEQEPAEDDRLHHRIERTHEPPADEEARDGRAHDIKRRDTIRARLLRPDGIDDAAADYEHQRHPDRHQVEVSEHDPQRELDDAVDGDVEHRAELTRLAAPARHVAIEPVGDEHEDQQRDVDQLPARSDG